MSNGHFFQYVSSFEELIAASFAGITNAISWQRSLRGDFEEIVNKFTLQCDIEEIQASHLLELQLSEQGDIARTVLLDDLKLLQDYGAAPVLNLIRCYPRDEGSAYFPTDVYSFHADRSTVPADTFLCTYHGAASEILSNTKVRQKIQIPEIRAALLEAYDGPAAEFDQFLVDHFLDLHYEADADAQPVNLGLGHMWRLAIDHPESRVQPCIHRAPVETDGQVRLLLIC